MTFWWWCNTHGAGGKGKVSCTRHIMKNTRTASGKCVPENDPEVAKMKASAVEPGSNPGDGK